MKNLYLLLALFLCGCVSSAEKARENLKIGMTKAEVMDIMGTPNYMSKGSNPPHWWSYYSSSSRNPDISVWFDSNGKLTEWRTGIPTGGSSSSSSDSRTLEGIDQSLKNMNNQMMFPPPR